MRKVTLLALAVAAAASVGAQQADPAAARRAARQAEQQERLKRFVEAEKEGVEVRIKDVARFRGVRPNQLRGFGLVIGLEGTGDSRKTPFTQQLLANALRDFGTAVDPSQMNLKNIAAVAVTCELPPFASPGNTVDVTVQSIGDAKSLQGGYLLQTPLYGAADKTRAYVVAQGPVSIGGFNVSAGGNSVQKNHVNVGRIPGGGIVEAAVATQLVFGDAMYLEIDDADFTTAQRIAAKLGELKPEYQPTALTGGTVQLRLPAGKNPVGAIAEIEGLTVKVDIPAVVVINERTGTVVVGGNVKVGPALVAKGSLQVRIQEQTIISQPDTPLAGGATVVATQTSVTADEDKTQVAMVAPNATVADLARIFQELRLSAQDIIAILQDLKAQGALKARIKVQ
ncbi:MAG: flagellar basal body P-ring protein FlgI [Fimbriimonadales bacterium]|nr:flagellar basal body P-ring protein FlgI [Fimbriimonadales bacterium]